MKNSDHDRKVREFIHKAYESLKDGDAVFARSFLKDALELDFEHEEVIYALKCLNWWIEKIKELDSFSDLYEQGGFILSQWESYHSFLERIGEAFIPGKEACDSCQYALKRYVFLKAMDCFLPLLRDRANQHDSALLLQAGRCCKGAGDWKDALEYLEQASRLKREDSAILSELADAKALLGDERVAKLLFREAFYLDPQAIYLSSMESELILGLQEKVRDLGYSGGELAEWIPVWGYIWRIFSIKRELKPVEFGRLKQSILSLENEYRSKKDGDPLIKPRLLNRYFWLIDHCEHNRDTSGLMDETILKIKFIDPDIHNHYRT
jgi:tetratricopeptide (TPR) repeat protein